MRGLGDLNLMFRQFYDLDSEKPGDEDWKKARHSFEKAYRAYLDALGVVPKSDYLSVKKRKSTEALVAPAGKVEDP